jgi:hypothetical protein
MNNRENRLSFKTIEIIVFTIIWFILFAIPYLQQQSTNTIFWDKIQSEWVRIAALLLLFLINILVLVPRLLFTKKYLKYTFAAILLILVINTGSVLLLQYVIHPEPISMPKMELGPRNASY